MLSKGKHRSMDQPENHHQHQSQVDARQNQLLLRKAQKENTTAPRCSLWPRITLASCIYILLFCVVLTLVTFGCVYFEVISKMRPTDTVSMHFTELNNYEKRELASFILEKPTLSLDFTNGFIILSQEAVNESKLYVERMPLQASRNIFSLWSVNLPDGMSNCHQMAVNLFCCNREYGPGEGTHCYVLEENELTNHLFAKSLQMTDFWQSLVSEGTMVAVKHKNNDHHIVDTSSASIFEIKNLEHRRQLTPISYFFSMESSEELSELAKENGEFVVCEYVKDNNAHYRLAGDEHGSICSKTRIQPIKNLDGVKFCANPVYQAVIQYDSEHGKKNKSKIRWMLQVAYSDDRDESVYRLEVIEKHFNSQIALNCEPTRIEIYIVAKSSLLKYTVHLPKEDVQSLLANDL